MVEIGRRAAIKHQVVSKRQHLEGARLNRLTRMNLLTLDVPDSHPGPLRRSLLQFFCGRSVASNPAPGPVHHFDTAQVSSHAVIGRVPTVNMGRDRQDVRMTRREGQGCHGSGCSGRGGCLLLFCDDVLTMGTLQDG